MNSFAKLIADERLLWFPELGIGWYPVKDQPYDRDYWAKYRQMDQTPVGAALTRARIDFVNAYYRGIDLCDIGIGGGRFVSERRVFGYDINPYAVEWLCENGRFRDPYAPVEAMTFWDSLEHIHDPRPLLANCRTWAFISCPIFDGPDHVLRSKHFRRDEHCWYFTQSGIERFMQMMGFGLVEVSPFECQWREDIRSFVFRRR